MPDAITPAGPGDDGRERAIWLLMVGLGVVVTVVVLEVSEQYAIKNYTLFEEALQSFTQLGFIRAFGRLSGKKIRVLFFPYTVARAMGSLAKRFEAQNGIARRVSAPMSGNS